MKKLLLTTLIAAGLGVAQTAFADQTNSGTITITGKVLDTTCKINGQDSGDLTVKLPPVSTKALASTGKTAGTTLFTIDLSECSSASSKLASKAAVYFSNDADKVTADGKLLNKLGGSPGDAAQNVVVQLLHKDDTVIDITQAYDQYTQDKDKVAITGNSPNGKAKLQYKARYYATDVAGAGEVKSTVNYTIAYE
uniref:F17-like fimbrial subunit n=1 Tax=Gallibacterium anatis TaxID=750 RepID=A0A1L2YZ17_9PAST|nr:F17-like fimbrial subunit [Gallibacterium anatis]